MSSFRRYPIGDSCICWSLGNTIDKDISADILRAYRLLSNQKDRLGILDLVPAYNAIAVHFDLLETNQEHLIEEVDGIISRLLNEDPSDKLENQAAIRSHEIPVVYDGEDLDRVAEISQLTVETVIDRHQAADYVVAMIGFLPHYPYLIGLDESLITPRLDSPRTKIPAGSVAIAGSQAGIYPSESPGGWNLLGTTDAGLLKSIEPGDIIRFKKVESL